MLRFVLLDLDDTILDFRAAERTALSRALTAEGIPPREELLALYSRINEAQWKRLERGELTHAQVKRERYVLLFEALGLRRDPAPLARRYEEELTRCGHLLPGARELLETLAGRWRLFALSNATAAVQCGRIARAGIGGFFEKIFLSQEAGVSKPDPGFFAWCFRQIPDFDRSRAVLVGDSLSSDIRGGRNAGLRTVWFSPGGGAVPADPDLQPDHVIRALKELPALLETL